MNDTDCGLSDNLNDVMQTMEETCNNFSSQINIIRSTGCLLKRVLGDCKKKDQDYSKKIADLAGRADHYEREAKKYSEQLEQNKSKLASKNSTIKSLNSALSDRNAENAKLQQKLQGITQQLAFKHDKNVQAKFTAKLLPLEGLLDYLQQNNEQLKQEIENLKSIVASQKITIQQLGEKESKHHQDHNIKKIYTPQKNAGIGDKEEAN